jgi:hypothetical protein
MWNSIYSIAVELKVLRYLRFPSFPASSVFWILSVVGNLVIFPGGGLHRELMKQS